jgi:hypothetical protein
MERATTSAKAADCQIYYSHRGLSASYSGLDTTPPTGFSVGGFFHAGEATSERAGEEEKKLVVRCYQE